MSPRANSITVTSASGSFSLVEGEPARHAEKFVERNAAARVALITPFRQQRVIGECDLAVLDP
jgi:hypothetical protein